MAYRVERAERGTSSVTGGEKCGLRTGFAQGTEHSSGAVAIGVATRLQREAVSKPRVEPH